MQKGSGRAPPVHLRRLRQVTRLDEQRRRLAMLQANLDRLAGSEGVPPEPPGAADNGQEATAIVTQEEGILETFREVLEQENDLLDWQIHEQERHASPRAPWPLHRSRPWPQPRGVYVGRLFGTVLSPVEYPPCPSPPEVQGSRGLCLARASGCVPLHGSCALVGVPPAGCLGVALFVTERYLWSFRPLTNHYLPALFVLIASCAHLQ